MWSPSPPSRNPMAAVDAPESAWTLFGLPIRIQTIGELRRHREPQVAILGAELPESYRSDRRVSTGPLSPRANLNIGTGLRYWRDDSGAIAYPTAGRTLCLRVLVMVPREIQLS